MLYIAKQQKVRKIIRLFIWIVLILIVVVTLIGFPIRINVEALEINFSEPDHVVKRTVQVQGRYRFRFFVREHKFIGYIRILEYPETLERVRDITMHQTPYASDIRTGLLVYTNGFGTIYQGSSLFREPWLIVVGGSLFDSKVIVPNVSSREEAIQVVHWFVRFAD